MKGYKGFNKDFKCRDMQYEVGKEFKADGEIVACENGLHFCQNPFDVFDYYAPNDSRFAEVEAYSKTHVPNDGDSKIATDRLYIHAELSLNEIIKAGVKFILDKIDFKDAAQNTGDQSAATNTGDYSAAQNTGYRSAATNTGFQSAAIVDGEQSVAISLGIDGKAKGKKGCWIVLAEWKEDADGNWNRINVQSFFVDGNIINENTFYVLKNGEPFEVE